MPFKEAARTPSPSNPAPQQQTNQMNHHFDPEVRARGADEQEQNPTKLHIHEENSRLRLPPLYSSPSPALSSPRGISTSSEIPRQHIPNISREASPTPTTTPINALSSRSPWLPILEASNQLVLYNPTSHALTITHSSLPPVPVPFPGAGVMSMSSRKMLHSDERSHGLGLDVGHTHGPGQLTSPEAAREVPVCPMCTRPLPPGFGMGGMGRMRPTGPGSTPLGQGRDSFSRRAPNYFQLLEEANFEAQSRPASPPFQSSGILSSEPLSPETPYTPDMTVVNSSLESATTSQQVPGATKADVLGRVKARLQVGGGTGDSTPGTPKRQFGENSMAQGYFATFFQEERRLGMGANGSVYLCRHVLDGNDLGRFAVKKIAVGHSHEYLFRILKEVRLLETLRHPNIVSYHHSWLETTRFSSFGPSIPTLHVLMEWAECGSLDDLIDLRQGKRHSPVDPLPGGVANDEDENPSSKSARIRAFKAAKQNQASAATNGRTRRTSIGASAGIHLLGVDEIKSFFSDIVSGLAFLHDRSILHLDLKMGNVLLTKDDDRIIPRAMLSDFGTSQDALQGPRVRSGNTGTVEYSAPEALARDQNGSLLQIDSRSDMWSLGMILHKLIFFRLPYPDIDPEDTDGIEREVLAYPGWKANPDTFAACKRRGLPRAILLLLESLLNRNPRERPTSERVLLMVREGTLEPSGRLSKGESTIVARRRSVSDEKSRSTSPPSTLALQKVTEPPTPVVFLEDGDTPPVSAHSPTSTPPLLKNIGPPPHSTAFSNTLAKLLVPEPLQPYARMLQTRWRTVRTCVLILKIISMGTVCRPAHVVHWMQALIVSVAVMDVWYEGESRGVPAPLVTLGLGVTHLLILTAVRWGRDSFCLL